MQELHGELEHDAVVGIHDHGVLVSDAEPLRIKCEDIVIEETTVLRVRATGSRFVRAEESVGVKALMRHLPYQAVA